VSLSFHLLFTLIVKPQPTFIQRLLWSPPQPNLHASSNSHAGTISRDSHYPLDFGLQPAQLCHLRQADYHSHLSCSNLPALRPAGKRDWTLSKLTTHLVQSSVSSVNFRPSSVVHRPSSIHRPPPVVQRSSPVARPLPSSLLTSILCLDPHTGLF
jgi:hypothetical protein